MHCVRRARSTLMKFYTRNYTPFNIKDEFVQELYGLERERRENSRLNSNGRSLRKSKFRPLGQSNIRLRAPSITSRTVRTRRRPTVRWPPRSFRATIPTSTTIPMSRTVTNTRSFPGWYLQNGATSAPRAAISGFDQLQRHVQRQAHSESVRHCGSQCHRPPRHLVPGLGPAIRHGRNAVLHPGSV